MKMVVYLVVGYDSMILIFSGVYVFYFIRNIVVLEDEIG